MQSDLVGWPGGRWQLPARQLSAPPSQPEYHTYNYITCYVNHAEKSKCRLVSQNSAKISVKDLLICTVQLWTNHAEEYWCRHLTEMTVKQSIYIFFFYVKKYSPLWATVNKLKLYTCHLSLTEKGQRKRSLKINITMYE